MCNTSLASPAIKAMIEQKPLFFWRVYHVLLRHQTRIAWMLKNRVRHLLILLRELGRKLVEKTEQGLPLDFPIPERSAEP